MRSLQQPAFECHAETASWSIAWSVEKKAWCCQHTGRGCEISGNPERLQPPETLQPAPRLQDVEVANVEVAAPRDLQGGIGATIAAKSLNQKKGPWCYLTRGQVCGSSSAPLISAATLAFLVMVPIAALCGIAGWQRFRRQEESPISLPRAEKLTTNSLPPQPSHVAGLKAVTDKPMRSCRMCS